MPPISDSVVRLRLPRAQKEQWEAAARKMDLTVSDFIRSAVDAHLRHLDSETRAKTIWADLVALMDAADSRGYNVEIKRRTPQKPSSSSKVKTGKSPK